LQAFYSRGRAMQGAFGVTPPGVSYVCARKELAERGICNMLKTTVEEIDAGVTRL
jgi:hypothetical protein